MFECRGQPGGWYLDTRRLAQKKGTKENGTPFRRPCGVPCVARRTRRLRNSAYGLKQSSPTSSVSAALLGGGKGGTSKTKKGKTEPPVRAKPGQAKTKRTRATRVTQGSLKFPFCAASSEPVRREVQASTVRAPQQLAVCASCQGELRSPRLSGSDEGTPKGRSGVAFFWVTFSWPSKKR